MSNPENAPESFFDSDLTFFTACPATLCEAAERRCDGLPVREARLADLSPALVRRFVPEWAEEPDLAGASFPSSGFLLNLGLAVGDPPRPTVAGILMATEDPKRCLPHAWIRCIVERSVTDAFSATLPQVIPVAGPLDRQVRLALDVVRKNAALDVASTCSSSRPLYALAAVFEALVNAVAHRDYGVAAPIELRLRCNRLDLTVPGALYGSMTTEDVPWRMATRNPILTSLLAKCSMPEDLFSTVTTDSAPISRHPMMHRVGEGARVIEAATEVLVGKKPTWTMTTVSAPLQSDFPALRLTIPAA